MSLLVVLIHCNMCIFSRVYGDYEFNLHSIQCVMKVCDVGIHKFLSYKYYVGYVLFGVLTFQAKL